MADPIRNQIKMTSLTAAYRPCPDRYISQQVWLLS